MTNTRVAVLAGGVGAARFLAVIDAVAHLGIRHIDLPCTPERVWRAIRAAETGNLPDPWSEPPGVFARHRRAADAPAEEDPASSAADAI
jgi:hypothetical protein